MYQKRKNMENRLLWLVDALCMVVSFAAAFYFRFHIWFGMKDVGDQLWHLLLMILLYFALNLMVDFNHHFFRRGLLEEVFQVIKAEFLFSASWVVLIFMMHRIDSLPRLVWGYFIVCNALLMIAARHCLKQYMLHVFKKGRYSNRLLLVADSLHIQEIVENLVRYNEWNHILTGIVLVDKDLYGTEVSGYPVVSSKEYMMDYIIHNDIDEVFINVTNDVPRAELQAWVEEIQQMGIIVDVNIDVFDLLGHGKKVINRVGKYAVVSFARNLFSTREMILKRTLDICGSLVGMLILGVATIFVAPAIKLESPGPVFFGQTRVGKNGRKFTFYKFRSMYQDAEQRKKDLMAQNEVQGLMFKMENDPRITKVGRFIRKTSIDELPQFWNILRGDMSLVGTRPPTIDEFDRYEAKHKCRLSMTPGLTGMWQVSGRSDIKDFDEVVRLDMEYIDNWTIWKDIKILLKTVKIVFTGKGSR